MLVVIVVLGMIDDGRNGCDDRSGQMLLLQIVRHGGGDGRGGNEHGLRSDERR